MLPADQKGNGENSSLLFRQKQQEYTVEIREKKKRDQLDLKRWKKLDANQDVQEKISMEIELIDLQKTEKVLVSQLDSQKWSEGDLLASVLDLLIVLTYPNGAQHRAQLVEYCEDSKILACLITIMTEKFKEFPKLQSKCCWCLCNLTALGGSSSKTCINAGFLDIIPSIISSMVSESEHETKSNEKRKDVEELLENCLWLLANLCGEDLEFRDSILKNGFIDTLLKVMKKFEGDVPKIRTATWLLSNIARGKPYPQIILFKPMFAILGRNIYLYDEKIVESTLLTLLNLTENQNPENLQAVYSIDINDQICELAMKSQNEKNRTLAFKCLRNMIYRGDQEIIDGLLNQGLVKVLFNKLEAKDSGSKSEALMFLSNLCVVENEVLLQKIIDTGLITKATNLIASGTDENRVDACHCLNTVLERGTLKQVAVLTNINVIDDLMDNLASNWSLELKKVSLWCLIDLVEKGKKFHSEMPHDDPTNPIIKQIMSASGYKNLEELLNHPDQEIFENARMLVDELITPQFHSSDVMMNE